MRPPVLAGFAALAVLACTWAGSARAVVDIRFERWGIPNAIRRDVVAPVDTTSAVGVSFDATVTASDLAHGLRFAIAERDPDGNDILVRFELQPCAPQPAVGADVVISASVDLYCDVSGELRVRDGVQWRASWCEAPEQRLCDPQGRLPAAALPSPSEPESWEFLVLGDGDVEGSFPTPDDVTACGTPTSSAQYVAPDFAQSGSIGVFADSTGVVCSDHLQPFEPFTWYVVAELDGMTHCGISVVELGITPLPPGFFVNVVPNPHAHAAIGSPFGQGGLGFSCERGDGERIVLYTLTGISTQPVSDLALQVTAGMPPSNEFHPYPWVDLCSATSIRVRRRMRTSTFYINPASNHDCDAPVPAVPTSWSAMKSLYSN